MEELKRLTWSELLVHIMRNVLPIEEDNIVCEDQLPLVPEKYLDDPMPNEIHLAFLEKGTYIRDLAALNDAITLCLCKLPTLLKEDESIGIGEFNLWKIGLDIRPKSSKEIVIFIEVMIDSLDSYQNEIAHRIKNMVENNKYIAEYIDRYHPEKFYIRKGFQLTII